MSRSLLLALLAALTLAAAIASLLFGPVDLSVGRLLATASGHGDSIATTILFELRLPRTVLALVVGAILGLAGLLYRRLVTKSVRLATTPNDIFMYVLLLLPIGLGAFATVRAALTEGLARQALTRVGDAEGPVDEGLELHRSG